MLSKGDLDVVRREVPQRRRHQSDKAVKDNLEHRQDVRMKPVLTIK